MMYAAQWDSCDVLEVEVGGLFGSDWAKAIMAMVCWCGNGGHCGEADGLCECERATRLRSVYRRDQHAQTYDAWKIGR
jgi:hypothetical protein